MKKFIFALLISCSSRVPVQGPIGPTGSQGVPGINGTNGVDGRDFTPTPDYFDISLEGGELSQVGREFTITPLFYVSNGFLVPWVKEITLVAYDVSTQIRVSVGILFYVDGSLGTWAYQEFSATPDSENGTMSISSWLADNYLDSNVSIQLQDNRLVGTFDFLFTNLDVSRHVAGSFNVSN